MEPQKSIVLPVVLAVLLSGVMFGGLGYYLANSQNAAETTTVTPTYTTQTTVTTQPTIVTTTSTPTSTIATDETASWKTYSNTKYSYSIKYPTNWAYREFPSTMTGAGFRLGSDPSDPAKEFVSIDYSDRATNDASMSFEDYVKVAAIHEIEGYEKLKTSEKVTTDSGVVGYITTWQYKDHSGTTKTSDPITYFPLQDGKLTGTIQVSGNIQALPLSATNLADYNKMIKTFKFTK